MRKGLDLCSNITGTKLILVLTKIFTKRNQDVSNHTDNYTLYR